MDSEEKENDPPEDFRLLNVAPILEDLRDENPFIRACKIKDPYDSTEHYLDVQFRLLREDFFLPLRRGLTEFIDNGQKFRNNDLFVYKFVKLVAQEINKKNNFGIKACFGNKKFFNLENSKRFKPGGLLLLSNDDFQNVIFATVLDTDPKILKSGFVLIEPMQQVDTEKIQKKTYTMLESKNYFEPYKAVLNALKLMNESNFPMKSYLVDASNSSKLPAYLKNQSLFSEVDTPWQLSQKRRLDPSQYNAFKHALSEELAVIQGPPGTGKTFIALEIVKTLLQFKRRWESHGPIVVVCFTNHALDQFLEGILEHTKSIVRIGGRSKSEKLKPFILRELKYRNRYLNNVNSEARRNLFDAKKKLENIMSNLCKVNCIIQSLKTFESIVPIECLMYCKDKDLSSMKSNRDLVLWLTGEKLNSISQRSDKCIQLNTFFNEFSNKENQEENLQIDDFSELDFKLEVLEGFKLTYPVRDIFYRIQVVNRRIEMIKKNIDPESQNNYVIIKQLNLWESHKKMLIEEQKTLRREFLKHPILYPGKQQTSNERWKKYWSWVQKSYYASVQHLNHLKVEHLQKSREVNEAQEIVDLDIIKKFKIVDLTTTAAARMHITLDGLHAPIVLVEEAAEILESHIVCSLTKHCQHLILIGDHKQLRPKPSDFTMAKVFKLEVSLFERMVNIRGNCNQLTTQHRMRPEIVKLITPSIYSELHNDKSVLEFPNVKGLDKNLFFLNHKNPEYKQNDEIWTNPFEAQFLIKFARHLVKQGYKSEEITVLCLYTGQLFELRKEKNKFGSILRNLYISTVDNYQGEENRIILLSLVRNNGEGQVGYLKEENRVCVALSRAREGLYITGNMDDLIVKNQIWPKIKKILEEQDAIGESISLRCQNHSEDKIEVKDASDFQQCPEGGCLKTCNAQLNCGHTCMSVCHILDLEHKNYKCECPCIKSCPDGHPCPLQCWQGCKPCRVLVKCTLKCKHIVDKPCSLGSHEFACQHKVKVVLPDCGHEVEKPCYLPIEKTKCTHPCENRVQSCGHSCVLNCHVNKDPDHLEYKCQKECAKECDNEHSCKKLCYQDCGPCPVIMEKERSCGHYYPKILCSENVEKMDCLKPCKRTLSCDHKCPMKCSQPCGNCPKKVEKTSTCGHKLILKCSQDAIPDRCNRPCQKILACGHSCTKRCKDPCSTKCETKVKLDQPGLCGHVFSVPCYLKNTDAKNPALLKYCNEPCQTLLECKHKCGGTCGECLQGRIHVQCKEPCSKILICGHECSIPCREECQPCTKPCEIRCSHSKCNKKCGSPCIVCNEKCTVGCEHQKCTKRCSQMCNITPCNEPCKKLLKCEHPCVGFCGEPCPPLCRICNKDELTEIFFGTEDEPEARFVYLENCKHCVESEGLSKWMEFSADESIGLKSCPKCKAPITKCMRVSNQIKKHLDNVLRVKKKIFTNNNKNLKELQVEQVNRLDEMKKNEIWSEFEVLNDLLLKMVDKGAWINDKIAHKKRKQELSVLQIDAFKVKLDIFHQLMEILSSIQNRNTSAYNHITKQVALIAASIPKEWLVTKQNLDDIQLEITRLHYLVEICNKITNELDLGSMKVLSIKRFTKEHESEVKDEMQKLNVGLTKSEREMIVKAMNLSQGHWFKCPNGHFYVITECGGATQVGKCNECNEPIGGTQHRLLGTNQLASEMDGATQSAWPGPLY